MPGIALLRWAFLETIELVISGAISLGDFSVLFTYFGNLFFSGLHSYSGL